MSYFSVFGGYVNSPNKILNNSNHKISYLGIGGQYKHGTGLSILLDHFYNISNFRIQSKLKFTNLNKATYQLLIYGKPNFFCKLKVKHWIQFN